MKNWIYIPCGDKKKERQNNLNIIHNLVDQSGTSAWCRHKEKKKNTEKETNKMKKYSYLG